MNGKARKSKGQMPNYGWVRVGVSALTGFRSGFILAFGRWNLDFAPEVPA